MVKIPCRLNLQVDHRFLTDGKDKKDLSDFNPEPQIDHPGTEKVGNGVLGLEYGFDPGAAGLISHLEKVEDLKAEPAVTGGFEDILRLVLLPFTAPEPDRESNINPMIMLVSISIPVDDIIILYAKRKPGANRGIEMHPEVFIVW